ncbi:hypothetical protein SSBR45G_27500 [Bradyrhizobium sp. SSBR45G]|nr:hypothetical protein SSBR45G_27500 [Bradyrhizobium sp. SSBR45G]GLH85536.1 hypothetical protein SSBR45R_29960 [Bradyrhizobium sp. SSBR45R]
MAATGGPGTACGSGGGTGPAPGPEGGARLTAAPGSGTEAGGTGGGRSLNSWADAGDTAKQASGHAKASASDSRPLRRKPMDPRPVVIILLLTENAANSSL